MTINKPYKYRIGIDARMYSTTFTGIGRVNYELIKRVITKASDIEFVLFMNNPEYDIYNFEGDNIRKVLVNAPYYSVSEQLIFLIKILQYDVDVMHFTNFNQPLLYPKKSISTIHDLIIGQFKKIRNKRFYSFLGIEKWAYKLCMARAIYLSSRIISISNSTKNDIVKAYPYVNNDKIEVIYNGVDINFKRSNDSEIASIKDKYGIDRYFFYVGNWSDHKNLVRLIEAFYELQKQYNDIKLVMTGSKNNRYTEVLEAIKQYNLEDNIVLVGHISDSDLMCLYSGAVAHIHPSLAEGFGIMGLEALATGTPTLLSDIASHKELYSTLEGVSFFDPYSIDAIKQAMIGALHTPKTVSTAQIESLKTLYSWDTMSDKVLDIYRQELM